MTSSWNCVDLSRQVWVGVKLGLSTVLHELCYGRGASKDLNAFGNVLSATSSVSLFYRFRPHFVHGRLTPGCELKWEVKRNYL